MAYNLSKKYKTLSEKLNRAIDSCINLSGKYGGIKSATGSHFYASALFALLTTRSISLRKLLPKQNPKTVSDFHWDYGSVCTLMRSLLETRLAFHYLGIELCSDDEWKCRWAIFCLHDDASRSKMLEGIAPSNFTPEEQTEYNENMSQHRAELQANKFFSNLKPSDQRHYLQGKQAYIYPLEEIASRCGLTIQHFRFFYTFLSQQAHVLPISYFRMADGNRGRGIHSNLEEQYHIMCIALLLSLLESSAEEMDAKFTSALQN